MAKALSLCVSRARTRDDLPPHSPDFNRIELAFSKTRAHLKKTTSRDRNSRLPERWLCGGQEGCRYASYV